MKTFAKTACLILLAGWSGSATAPAQTNQPAATTTNRPGPATKLPSRRFGGNILSVDSKAKTITLQGGIKIVIAITDKTRIIKAKKPATFDALAAGQAVTGIEQLNGGKWQAQTLNVGDPRQIPDEPVGKTFVPTAKTNAVKTNAVTGGGN